MLTDSILRLKIAFASLPMKGLFFWEGLLFLKDDEYTKIVEEKFISTMRSFPEEDKEQIEYYKEILQDLKKTRKDISDDLAIRVEVEKIREALVSEAAHETIIDAIKDNMKTQEIDRKE